MRRRRRRQGDAADRLRQAAQIARPAWRAAEATFPGTGRETAVDFRTMDSARRRAAHPGLPQAAALLVLLLGRVPGAGAGADRAAAAPVAEGHVYGVRHAPPRQPGAVRIAAYNVLNLFDHDDDPALSGAFDDVALALSPERGTAIADAMRRLDADVLALSEVESLAALGWFRDTFAADLGYAHLASADVGDRRGIECAVLSRFPIEFQEVRIAMPIGGLVRVGPGFAPPPDDRPVLSRFHRSPLRCDIRVRPDTLITLLVVHHKAGRGWEHARESEALGTIAWAREIERAAPGHPIVILGDFNASPLDKAVRLYLEAGFADAFAHRAIAGLGGSDPVEADRFRTHESGRVIDHVLLGRHAFAWFVPGSAFVLSTPLEPGRDWSIAPTTPGYASDHLPVAVELVIPARTGAPSLATGGTEAVHAPD